MGQHNFKSFPSHLSRFKPHHKLIISSTEAHSVARDSDRGEMIDPPIPLSTQCLPLLLPAWLSEGRSLLRPGGH